MSATKQARVDRANLAAPKKRLTAFRAGAGLLLLAGACAVSYAAATTDRDASLDWHAVAIGAVGTLLAVLGWYFKTYRAETRESLHAVRDAQAGMIARLAVIEALQKERNSTLEIIRDVLENGRSR